MQPAGSYYIQLSEQAEKPEHNLHAGNKAGNDPEHVADIVVGLQHPIDGFFQF